MGKQLKKIVLIGPVYPYKGGISHYTGLMYRALEKKYDVTMLSFKLQYPKFMFKKEQKDFENTSFKIDNTGFLINTINPFNWIKTAYRIKKANPDLIIFQWWHPYFAPCYWTITKLLKRIKVLFICHNVYPHERFPMDHFLTNNVLKNGNYFIVQSNLDAKDLTNAVSNPDFKQTVHPTYNAFKFLDIPSEEARKILKIDKNKKVILFFGFVRQYKGLKHLINALPLIVDHGIDLEVLIVGDFGDDKQEYINLITSNQVEGNIRIYDGYIPDKEVEKFFSATNVVVLPYESATQSGIVQIAYAFNKPVIVSDVGGLPDVVVDGKTGYIVQNKNPKKLAGAIIKYFDENKELEFSKNVSKEADKYSWDRMVETIEELYE